MAGRYFEIIVTGRQLAAFVLGMVVLLLAAFGVGVGVGVLQPAPPVEQVIVIATPTPTPFIMPTAAPSAPTPAPTAPAPVPTPRPVATRVSIPPATPTVVVAGVGRWVQVVVVSGASQADGVRQRVIALGYTPRQVAAQAIGDGKFRIRVGAFPNEESAGRVSARLRAEGFAGAFVVKLGD